MLAEGALEKSLLLKLIVDVEEIISKILACRLKLLGREPNMVRIQGDASVIGDIHGQFYDLVHMYEKLKKPPITHLLFLGDYVDRGIYCVEVLAFLFALKVFRDKSSFLVKLSRLSDIAERQPRVQNHD